jgi:hypothetical protein
MISGQLFLQSLRLLRALPIVSRDPCRRSTTADSSCGEFVQFNLVTDFLQACGRRFNLFFQAGNGTSYACILDP